MDRAPEQAERGAEAGCYWTPVADRERPDAPGDDRHRHPGARAPSRAARPRPSRHRWPLARSNGGGGVIRKPAHPPERRAASSAGVRHDDVAPALAHDVRRARVALAGARAGRAPLAARSPGIRSSLPLEADLAVQTVPDDRGRRAQCVRASRTSTSNAPGAGGLGSHSDATSRSPSRTSTPNRPPSGIDERLDLDVDPVGHAGDGEPARRGSRRARRRPAPRRLDGERRVAPARRPRRLGR